MEGFGGTRSARQGAQGQDRASPQFESLHSAQHSSRLSTPWGQVQHLLCSLLCGQRLAEVLDMEGASLFLSLVAPMCQALGPGNSCRMNEGFLLPLTTFAGLSPDKGGPCQAHETLWMEHEKHSEDWERAGVLHPGSPLVLGNVLRTHTNTPSLGGWACHEPPSYPFCWLKSGKSPAALGDSAFSGVGMRINGPLPQSDMWL